MQIFGSRYECYVPDTHIIYPAIFLSDIAILSTPNNTYRKCMNALKENFIVKFLPENEAEFNRLILRKFMAFLDDIKREAVNARAKGLTARQFKRNVTNLLSLRKVYDDRDCGDLRLYWNAHEEDFAVWLEWDRLTIETRVNELVSKKLEEYKDFAESYKHTWNEKDKVAILTIYGMLKLEREHGSLTNQAHDEDLQLLSGCLLYAWGKPEDDLSGYLPEGVLYLVTDDDDFITCGKQVQKLEAFGAGKGKKLTGFDVIKPKDFLDQLDAYNSSHK